MHRTVPFVLAFLLLAAPASAAERSLSVTSFDKIRLDGPYGVQLTTGVSPYARVKGSTAAIDSVSVSVQGRTLVVSSNPSAWGGYPGESAGPVTIEVGTHDLRAAFVNGSGSLAVNRVKGLEFSLSLQGSGTASVDEAEIDQLSIGLSGAASARISGNAPKLTAIVRGTSSLDATQLSTKDATIGAEGPSTVRAMVSNSAKIDARGVSVVEVSGAPACTVKAQGSATVRGCEAKRGTGRSW